MTSREWEVAKGDREEKGGKKGKGSLFQMEDGGGGKKGEGTEKRRRDGEEKKKGEREEKRVGHRSIWIFRLLRPDVWARILIFGIKGGAYEEKE